MNRWQNSFRHSNLSPSIRNTYWWLRWGMVSLAFAFPLLLWFGNAWFFQLPVWPPRDSMSAYYASGMRDWFVGVLFSVAACLVLYKGLTAREDYFLNCGGFFAAGIAVNPFDSHPAGFPAGLSPHGIFAGLFFLMLALDCWLCQSDSLRPGVLPEQLGRWYKAFYNGIGVALVLVPAGAFVVNTWFLGRVPGSSLFFIEMAAIWVFAFYWAVKSGELEFEVRK